MKKELLIDLDFFLEKISRLAKIISHCGKDKAEVKNKLQDSFNHFKEEVKSINEFCSDINFCMKKLNALLKYFRMERIDFEKIATLHVGRDEAHIFYSILEEIVNTTLAKLNVPQLQKAVPVPKQQNDDWKNHKIKFEQDLFETIDKKCSNALSILFGKIKKLVREKYTSNCPETVGVIYAWPKEEGQWYQAERYLQEFLKIFKKHIEASGVPNFILDILSNPAGNNLAVLRDEIVNADIVIPVGTESFKFAIEKMIGPLEREYTPLKNRHNKVRTHDKTKPWEEKYPCDENFILPMLYSGSNEKSWPHGDFDYRVTVKPMIGKFCYYVHLQKWINDIFRFKYGELNALFAEFESEVSKILPPEEWRQISKGMTEADVTSKLGKQIVLPVVNAKTTKKLSEFTQGSISKPVIIFTDPGVDDVVMLGQALSKTGFKNICGIVASAGNVQLEHIKRNVLGMLKLTRRTNIPVFEGSQNAVNINYVRQHDHAVHGPIGLGPNRHEPLAVVSDQELNNFGKCDELVDRIKNSSEKVTLISIAGLTDVFYVLSRLDEIGYIHKIDCIAMMGGVFEPKEANAPKSSNPCYGEFNFCSDPDATAGVFGLCKDSGIKIVLAPLDITHNYNLYDKQRTQEMKRLDENGTNPAAKVIAEILDDVPEPYKQRYSAKKQPVHDLFASMSMLHPELFECELIAVRCNSSRDKDPGKVVVDDNAAEKHVYLLKQVNDQSAFYACYLESLQSYTTPFAKRLSPVLLTKNVLTRTGSPVHERSQVSLKASILKESNENIASHIRFLEGRISKIPDLTSGLSDGLIRIKEQLERIRENINEQQYHNAQMAIIECRDYIHNSQLFAPKCAVGSNSEIIRGDIIYRTEACLIDIGFVLTKLQCSEMELSENIVRSKQLIDEQLALSYQGSPFSDSLDQVCRGIAKKIDEPLTVYLFLPELPHGTDFQDSRTESFLAQLSKDLTRAGLSVIYKRTQLNPGESKSAFNDKAGHSKFVILFCTPELTRLYYDQAWSNNNTDLVDALKKQNLDTKFSLNRVLPVVINGFANDLPPYLRGAGVQNWVELGYLQGVKQLLSHIYCRNQPNEDFNRCWTTDPAVESLIELK